MSKKGNGLKLIYCTHLDKESNTCEGLGNDYLKDYHVTESLLDQVKAYVRKEIGGGMIKRQTGQCIGGVISDSLSFWIISEGRLLELLEIEREWKSAKGEQ